MFTRPNNTNLWLLTLCLASVWLLFTAGCSGPSSTSGGESSTPEGSSVAPAETSSGPKARPQLLPTPGEPTLVVEGCAAEPAGDDTRSVETELEEDDYVVQVLGNGIIVNALQQHRCCLEGSSAFNQEAETLYFDIHLEGSPCRCMCNSTFKGAIALEPGDYQLKVRRFEGEDQEVVYEQGLSIQSERPGAANQ